MANANWLSQCFMGFVVRGQGLSREKWILQLWATLRIRILSTVYANVKFRKIQETTFSSVFSDFKVPPGYRLVLEEVEKPKPEADSFDFTETLLYYMLPSFFIFLAIALIFYLFHPYTTDDKCFEFQQRLVRGPLLQLIFNKIFSSEIWEKSEHRPVKVLAGQVFE